MVDFFPVRVGGVNLRVRGYALADQSQALVAQLLRSQDGQDPPMVSFNSSGLSVDLEAGRTRAFAMKPGAHDVDRLAAPAGRSHGQAPNHGGLGRSVGDRVQQG